MDQSKGDVYLKRRKEVEEIVEDRFELQRKALKIVERLTETNIDEDFFRCCAEFILPTHYADVVEERAIDNTCGYPLCDNPIPKMTTQRYHISMRSNKVYDITERKCFCQPFCYRASKYYQAQIPTVPLWSRSKERFEEVKLLKEDSEALARRGKPPESMVVRLRVKEEEIEHPPPKGEGGGDSSTDQEGDLVDDVSILSLSDTREQKKRYNKFEREEARQRVERKAAKSPIGEQHSGQTIETCDNRTAADKAGDAKNHVKSMGNPGKSTVGRNSVGKDMKSVESKRKDPSSHEVVIKEDGSSANSSGKGGAALVNKYVFKCILEWRTAESAKYLRRSLGSGSEGNQNAKLQVGVGQNSNGASDDLLANGDGPLQVSPETERMPVTDSVEGSKQDVGHEDTRNGGGVVSFAATKPAPDVETLRQESERFALKVKQFYALRPDKLLPSTIEEEKSKATKEKAGAMKAVDSAVPISLPPVDSHSQMTIRRKIFLDRVHKVYRELLPPLDITLPDVSSDLRDLVSTFDLRSHNISFKPAGWTLVSLCLLHLLAHRQTALHGKLIAPRARAFLSAVWEPYGIIGEDVGNLVEEFVRDAS